MEMESCVPPGFRFHPTEEELVGYYLNRKINAQKIDLDVIVEIDLYRMEPWDIQASCNLGYDEQNEWYFFSHKDKKYPTGTRTNRATAAGFWKATGRDKAVLSKNIIIGMRKTLVFYKGRAPNGCKTDWIMHEYRLQTSENGPPQEEGWVVCRAFKKPTPNHNQGYEAWHHAHYHAREIHHNYNNIRSPSFSDIMSSTHMVNSTTDQTSSSFQHPNFGHDHSSDNNTTIIMSSLDNQLIELPNLDSPSNLSTSFRGHILHEEAGNLLHTSINNVVEDVNEEKITSINTSGSGQFIDWKVLDNLLSSQLAQTSSFTSHHNFPSVP